MADNEVPLLSVSTEDRRAAVAQFERASQVIAGGNQDYGIQLLLGCCRLDPGHLIYRQTLRQIEKARYKHNLRGSRLAWLTASPARARLRAAKRSRAWQKVLTHGEEVLTRNPWDTGAQVDMAEAADTLGLPDLAIWLLEQARQKETQHTTLNRTLARLYEKRGNFVLAIALWELVGQADPSDIEANHKAKELASLSIQQSDLLRADALAEALQARVEKDPTDVAACLELAESCRKAGQVDRARAVLQQGLGPTGHDFQITLALAELELEPFRQDLAITEGKLRANPDDTDLRKLRARLLKEINTRELEVQRLKADRFPGELSHHLEMGICLLRSGQLDEAIRELQTARTDPRLSGRALLYLGHCFKHRQSWQQAEQHFAEALASLGDDDLEARKDAWYQLALGCADAGDLPAALEWAHELVQIDAGYRDIAQLLEDWQSRLQEA